MATPVLYAQPQNFNFSPGIIPPSPGDLEEARIRRSMDLAKLRELTLAPGFEQQRLNLAGQAQTNEQKYRTGVLSETSTHNIEEEKHWADLLGLDQSKLQETARQHNTALSELTDYHKGLLKNQLAGDFMAHIAPLYTGDPKKVQAATGALTPILDKLGLHQITAGLELATQKQNQDLAKTTLSQIELAKKAGVDHTPILSNLKATDPDVYDMIKGQFPTTSGPVKSTQSGGYKLGKILRAISTPASAGAMSNLAMSYAERIKHSGTLQDFIRATTE